MCYADPVNPATPERSGRFADQGHADCDQGVGVYGHLIL